MKTKINKFIKYTLLYFIRANECNQLGLFYNFVKFNPLVLIYQDLKN